MRFKPDYNRPHPGEWKLGSDLSGASDTVVAVEVDPAGVYAFPETLEAYKGLIVFESCSVENAALIVEMHEALRAYGASLLSRDALIAEGKMPTIDHAAIERVIELAKLVASLEVL